MNLQTNPQLELALDYVRGTTTSVFLTGKAGSGKTTFLHQVKAEGSKRMAVVAPTGVAAINAGGMTIHSFFQLPFGIHLPDGNRLDENRRFARKKINLIRSLDLLVIDEISMVRADMLDAIDHVLRRLRQDSRPFGGVQLLMIGDLHQLPPVVKPEDWDTLSRYYDTPYFFGCQALQKTNYVSIELKHIYRQSDIAFIELLNRVRDNCLDDETLRILNSRFIPNFQPPNQEAYITLTATNAAAWDINAKQLKLLAGKSHILSATIDGEFPPSSYPTEEQLEFKTGAQVMFIKNDLQPEKRYFNGKIGRIVRVANDSILVRCADDATDIEVTPAEWQNVKYSLNESTKEIEEQILGTFTQYPLKLAWAITIHKSQGLTFERAIIDAQAAFAHGQVYVALSRCKSFEGIVLRSTIAFSSVKTDPVVKQYSEQAERNAPTQSQIEQSKRQYQQLLMEELFSFRAIQQSVNRLQSTYKEHQTTLTLEACNQVATLAKQIHESLIAIADKFQPQLAAYLQQVGLPESNESLQERIRKAAIYFTEKIAGLLQEVSAIPTASDNQTVRGAAIAQLEALQLGLFVKQATFTACSRGFSTAAFQRGRVDAELDFAARNAAGSPADLKIPKGVPHPELYGQLLHYRQQMAEKHGISPRDVLTNLSLGQLVLYLPTTHHNVRLVHGIGKERLKRYGNDICGLVRQFCEAAQLPTDQMSSAKSSALRPASDTKSLSFEMFQAGKTIEQITIERKLAQTTIEGHLAHFVAMQQLDIHRLLSQERLAELERFFLANPAAMLSDAKTHFGDKYGYGELRLAFSHFRRDAESDGRTPSAPEA